MSEDKFNPGWPKNKSKVSMKETPGKSQGKYLRARDAFTFGKYKGHIILDVAKTDPSYVKWALENIDWFIFRPEDRKLLEEIINDDVAEKPFTGIHGKASSVSNYQDTADRFKDKERGLFGDNEYDYTKPPWEDQ